jgi:hypothetical protein
LTVAILPIFYQLGFWSLLPQNTQWQKFIGVDFTLDFSVLILREIK